MLPKEEIERIYFTDGVHSLEKSEQRREDLLRIKDYHQAGFMRRLPSNIDVKGFLFQRKERQARVAQKIASNKIDFFCKKIIQRIENQRKE